MLTMKQEYDELIAKLTPILPFEVYATRDFVVQMRQKFKITLNTKLRVANLHNMMEVGGVCCGIENLEHIEGKEKEVVICGLTHLIIPNDNPFYTEIIKYQTKRVKWLSKQ
jgi:DNA-binding transcriptional regulator YbjK